MEDTDWRPSKCPQCGAFREAKRNPVCKNENCTSKTETQDLAADEIERLRNALIRIEDLTQHGMGMNAGEETVVWREAHNALKQKGTD